MLKTGFRNRRQGDPDGWVFQAAPSKAEVGKGGEGRRGGREGVLPKHERVGFRAGGMGEGVRNGDEGLTGGCRGAGSDLNTRGGVWRVWGWGRG